MWCETSHYFFRCAKSNNSTDRKTATGSSIANSVWEQRTNNTFSSEIFTTKTRSNYRKYKKNNISNRTEH